MKNIFLHKITLPVMLTILLTGGVGSVCNAEGDDAAKAAKAAEAAAAAKAAKAAQKIAEYEKAIEAHKTAEEAQKKAQESYKQANISQNLQVQIKEAKTVKELEALKKASPDHGATIDRAIEVKKKVEEAAKALKKLSTTTGSVNLGVKKKELEEIKASTEKEIQKLNAKQAEAEKALGDHLTRLKDAADKAEKKDLDVIKEQIQKGAQLTKAQNELIDKLKNKISDGLSDAEKLKFFGAAEAFNKYSEEQGNIKKQIEDLKKIKETSEQAFKDYNDKKAFAEDALEKAKKLAEEGLNKAKNKFGIGAGGLGIGSLATIGSIIGLLAEGKLDDVAGMIVGGVLGEGAGKFVKDKLGDLLNSDDAINNDEIYNKALSDVVALFANFDQDIKKILEKNTDYTSNIFSIEAGTVTVSDSQVTINIKYDLEKTDFGTPLIPVVVTLSPDEILSIPLTTNTILEKMEDGAAKDMLTLVANPTASFIFTLKLIQLINFATKDVTKNETAKIEYILDQITVLYSRFILSTDEDTTPEALLSYIQKYPVLLKLFNDKNVKVYKELVDDAEISPEDQTSAFKDMQKSELLEGPLTDALKILYNHFHQIYYRKFQHDGGFKIVAFEPGSRAIKNSLQSIFYRGMKDLLTCSQEILQSEGKITLRKLDGTEYEFDAKSKFENLIKKDATEIQAATVKLNDAMNDLNKLLDSSTDKKVTLESQEMKEAKNNYDKAMNDVKTARDHALQTIINFRKNYATLYPIIWDDGTSFTPADFLISEIKTLNDKFLKDTNKDINTILTKTYKPFKKYFGLTEKQLLAPKPLDPKVKATATTVSKPVEKPVKPSTSTTKPVQPPAIVTPKPKIPTTTVKPPAIVAPAPKDFAAAA